MWFLLGTFMVVGKGLQQTTQKGTALEGLGIHELTTRFRVWSLRGSCPKL